MSIETIKNTIIFFRTVIQSGESWNYECQRQYDKALSELEPAEPSELKSKIESQIQHLRNQKLCHTANLFVKIVSEFDRLTAENQRIQKASIKLGSWMSAALEDDKVCEEMKSDVREWFDSLGKE